MDEEEGPKDIWPSQSRHSAPSLPPLPSFTSPTSRRIRSLLPRRARCIPRTALRRLRWLIGPAQPHPDTDIPLPQASLTLSFTLFSKSRVVPLDSFFTSLSRRLRLHYALYPFLLLWITANILLIRQQWYLPNTPDIIPCSAALWNDWPVDVCGLNGTGCEPYLQAGTYRCMGTCTTVLGNPRWVGGEEVNGVPLVIGGGDDAHTYRADSWICPAAIHSGLISKVFGGCVDVVPLPYPAGFSSYVGSTANGVSSLSFSPTYPGAFTLSKPDTADCIDYHPIITPFNVACLFLFTLLLRPSPHLLFITILVLGYFQIVLISDTRYTPPSWEYTFSNLPTVLLTGYAIWRFSFRRTLKAFKDLPLDLAIWQGAGLWISLEYPSTLERIPIQRLGYGGLTKGGIAAITIIVIVVIGVVLVQAWTMRKIGLVQYYLVRYIWLAPLLLGLAFIPHLTLRLHHYLLALAALPVLSLPNRISAFGQAFMLGLFLDGIGRWGWASIVEETASLLGDAIAGTGVPMMDLGNSTSEALSWIVDEIQYAVGYEGVGVVVDDILTAGNITSNHLSLAGLGLQQGIDHFFRLAYFINGTSLDYTDPFVLAANGNWGALT